MLTVKDRASDGAGEATDGVLDVADGAADGAKRTELTLDGESASNV